MLPARAESRSAAQTCTTDRPRARTCRAPTGVRERACAEQRKTCYQTIHVCDRRRRRCGLPHCARARTKLERTCVPLQCARAVLAAISTCVLIRSRATSIGSACVSMLAQCCKGSSQRVARGEFLQLSREPGRAKSTLVGRKADVRPRIRGARPLRCADRDDCMQPSQARAIPQWQ